jgi:hypothetical protein
VVEKAADAANDAPALKTWRRGSPRTSVRLNATRQPDGGLVGTDRHGDPIEVRVVEDLDWSMLRDESAYARITINTNSTHRVRAMKLALLVRELDKPGPGGEKQAASDKAVARAIFKDQADKKDGTWSTWLVGSSAPTGDDLFLVAGHFGVDPAWLASETDLSPPVRTSPVSAHQDGEAALLAVVRGLGLDARDVVFELAGQSPPEVDGSPPSPDEAALIAKLAAMGLNPIQALVALARR